MDIQELRNDLAFLKKNLNEDKSVIDAALYNNLLYSNGCLTLFNPKTKIFATVFTDFESEDSFLVPLNDLDVLLKRFKKGDIDIAYDADANLIQASLSGTNAAEFLKARKKEELDKYPIYPKKANKDTFTLVTSDRDKLFSIMDFLSIGHPVSNDLYFMDNIIIDSGNIKTTNSGYAYNSLALTSTDLANSKFVLTTEFTKFSEFMNPKQKTFFAECVDGYTRLVNGYRFISIPNAEDKDLAPIDKAFKQVSGTKKACTIQINPGEILSFIDGLDLETRKLLRNRLVFSFFKGTLNISDQLKFKGDNDKVQDWRVMHNKELAIESHYFKNDEQFGFSYGYDLIYIEDMLRSLDSDLVHLTFVQSDNNPNDACPILLSAKGKNFLLHCLG